MKIGFLVNDCLPEMGLPCSGQGLRAWGLIKGLRESGTEAYALIRHSTLGTRFRRWKDISGSEFPDWLVIVNHETIGPTIKDLDALVFHNWAAGDEVTKPADSKVKFIYDFFSATMIEHSFISSDPEYMTRIETRKHKLLKRCDLFFANGPGRQKYANRYLASLGIRTPVRDIPMSLPWLGEATSAGPILVGGYQQDWTKALDGDMLGRIATSFPDRALVTVGAGQHYHFGSRETAAPDDNARPDNIVAYDSLAFSDYVALNAVASAFVDVAPINKERLISFSSRGILSIATGCPIIHNEDTDLGALVKQFDAGVVVSQNETLDSPDMMIAKLTDCMAADRRKNCKALWNEKFNSRKGAATLEQMVRNG